MFQPEERHGWTFHPVFGWCYWSAFFQQFADGQDLGTTILHHSPLPATVAPDAVLPESCFYRPSTVPGMNCVFRFFLADGGYPIRCFRAPFQHEYTPADIQHIEIHRSICLRVRHYRVRTRWREELWALDAEGNYLANQGEAETFDTAVSVDLVTRM